MQVITRWTGGQADALRQALRMTNESYAEHLGVAVRTIAYWRKRPEIIRGADPDAGPGDFALGRQPQYRHRLLIVLGLVVDPAVDLRCPQLDAVVLEQRRHRRVLAAIERPLVFPGHDRIPLPVRVGELRDEGGGLRAAGPGELPGLPHVEELRHDLPWPRTSASACSRCRARDITGSCQSSVDTRP